MYICSYHSKLNLLLVKCILTLLINWAVGNKVPVLSVFLDIKCGIFMPITVNVGYSDIY